LSDLVHQGKVRYIGSSTFPAADIIEAQWAADKRGHERFVCEQPPYSMLVRGIETDVLPTIEKYAMGAITWSPLAGGWLSGAYRVGAELPTSLRASRIPWRYDMSIPSNQHKLEVAEQLAKLAESSGMSLVHMAVAFTLAHPGVTASIIGPRTIEQLDTQLGAAELTLSADVLDEIDAIVAPGTNLNRADAGYLPPSLTDARLRRR
jgi:aryl-alcohol dehydrogenase-like predicted oxidoreductase